MMTMDRHKIPITILICDDDEDDRLLTQQALEDAHIANDSDSSRMGSNCWTICTNAGRTPAKPGRRRVRG